MDDKDTLATLSKSTESSELDERYGQSSHVPIKLYLHAENVLLRLRDQYFVHAEMEFPKRVTEIQDILDKYGGESWEFYEELNVPPAKPIYMNTKLTVAQLLSAQNNEIHQNGSQKTKCAPKRKFSSLQKQCEYNRRKVEVIITSDLFPIKTQRVYKGTNTPIANYNGYIQSSKMVAKLHEKLKEEIVQAQNDLGRIIVAMTIQLGYHTVHRTNKAECTKEILQRLRHRLSILVLFSERIFKYYKRRAELIRNLIHLPFSKDLRAAINWTDWNEYKTSYLSLSCLRRDYVYFLNSIAYVMLDYSFQPKQ